jgi:hypothetical protein
VVLSGVKSPSNLCILLPDDMDDFTIRPAVDVDIVQILEKVQSSRPLPIPQISPGDNTESGIASIGPSDATLSDKFLCPDDDFDAPEDQIRCVPCLDQDAVRSRNYLKKSILRNRLFLEWAEYKCWFFDVNPFHVDCTS